MESEVGTLNGPSIEGVMIRLPRPQLLGPLVPILTLVLMLPACKREDPQIRELTRKASQADEYMQELREVWRQQQKHFPLAGLTAIQPDRLVMELSPEQRRFLEDRINHERDSSRRAILRETLAMDSRIRELKTQLAELKVGLPEPDIAKGTDSHYGLAMQFLAKQGLSEAQARKCLADVPLLARLIPGFEVYHFYNEGRYSTWVGQGQAVLSPPGFNRTAQAHLQAQCEAADAQGRQLQKKRTELESQKTKVEAEIASLVEERARLQQDYDRLQEESSEGAAKLSSLHYLVGLQEDLVQKDIIELPIFARTRAGRNWNDSLFSRSLDLRFHTSILVRASDLGLRSIRKVILVPGSFVLNQDYGLTLSEDRQSAYLELLALDRFKNEKLVLAVSD